ncbi:MAG TPA: hypothetical protein VFJ76_07815 [Solirubrobacterales bacterium]|nr:hypothetical protein [Solirubrobacterales bacterium]
MTLALLHALKDIGIDLAIVGMVALIVWLIAETDREVRKQLEQEDLEAFEQWASEQKAPDWQWPDPPAPLRAEYVAKPKARVR